MKVVTKIDQPMKEALDKIVKSKLKATVGWLESSKYPNGTSVAYVATIQEFGYAPKGIPPRPFWRPTVEAQEQRWKDLFKSMVKKKMSPRECFDAVGLKASGDIRKAISNVTTPALKPSTIANRKRRGNNNTHPLADTGVMMQTLTSVVE